uniref:Uncharacterized protein n=1 Tax=Strigamia maritima TaxID=126957 RepID=T1JKD9_STRMM
MSHNVTLVVGVHLIVSYESSVFALDFFKSRIEITDAIMISPISHCMSLVLGGGEIQIQRSPFWHHENEVDFGDCAPMNMNDGMDCMDYVTDY